MCHQLWVAVCQCLFAYWRTRAQRLTEHTNTDQSQQYPHNQAGKGAPESLVIMVSNLKESRFPGISA